MFRPIIFLWVIILLIPQVDSVASQENTEIFSDNHLSLYNIDENGLALQGYDPVDLFRLKDPTPGKPEFSATYQERLYHFSSKFNKKTFLKNPERYEPQYGGWCTYYISLGFQRKIDVNFIVFKNDKIYAFSGIIPQVRFLENQESMLKRADIRWKSFQRKNLERRKNEF